MEGGILLRESLASVLNRYGFEVVGQAADAAQLLALVRQESLPMPGLRQLSDHST